MYKVRTSSSCLRKRKIKEQERNAVFHKKKKFSGELLFTETIAELLSRNLSYKW